jgi:hypothetical protein
VTLCKKLLFATRKPPCNTRPPCNLTKGETEMLEREKKDHAVEPC